MGTAPATSLTPGLYHSKHSDTLTKLNKILKYGIIRIPAAAPCLSVSVVFLSTNCSSLDRSKKFPAWGNIVNLRENGVILKKVLGQDWGKIIGRSLKMP